MPQGMSSRPTRRDPSAPKGFLASLEMTPREETCEETSPGRRRAIVTFFHPSCQDHEMRPCGTLAMPAAALKAGWFGATVAETGSRSGILGEQPRIVVE